jgi:hypothetical protein
LLVYLGRRWRWWWWLELILLHILGISSWVDMRTRQPCLLVVTPLRLPVGIVSSIIGRHVAVLVRHLRRVPGDEIRVEDVFVPCSYDGSFNPMSIFHHALLPLPT